jgi:hypothetical protein
MGCFIFIFILSGWGYVCELNLKVVTHKKNLRISAFHIGYKKQEREFYPIKKKVSNLQNHNFS